jgi:hypothetical protein
MYNNDPWKRKCQNNPVFQNQGKLPEMMKNISNRRIGNPNVVEIGTLGQMDKSSFVCVNTGINNNFHAANHKAP